MVDAADGVKVFTPYFRIEVDGVDRTRNIWEYLVSVDYEDAEDGESDVLDFSVANDPAFSVPKRGAKVRFWLGWKEKGSPKYFGAFTVDEVAIELKPAVMRVSAKSADFNSSAKGSTNEKERRDREWENITLADIAAKIAAEHGYSSKVEVDVHYPYIAQTGESNLSFLRRLAGEMRASFAVKDNTILIYPPGKGSRGQATITYSESVTGSFTMKARSEYGEVEAKWWETAGATEKRVTSKRKKKKKSRETWYTSAGDGTKHTIQKRYASASEAQTAADNYMTELERGEFEANLTVPGDPAIVAGVEVILDSFKPTELDGRYLAKAVSHSVSKSGWTTKVKLESLE